MKPVGQSSLEYLMTYGWALVIIATIIGVLVFIATPAQKGTAFYSSDNAKIMMKGGTLSSGSMKISLQNITGGEIKIIDFYAVGYYACKINSLAEPEITIRPGGEIIVECNAIDGESGEIYIEYKDYSGLEKNVSLSAKNPGSSANSISSCPFTISQSGSYTIAGNISGTGTCITITAYNVLLDCKGGTITGNNTGNGIYLNGTENTTIRNCNVRNFQAGIQIDNSSYSTISNNSAKNNARYGIVTIGSSNNGLIGNDASNNTFHGIYLTEYSNENRINSNTANGNTSGGGIVFSRASQNLLKGNIANNSAIGIYLSNSSNNTLEGNIVRNNVANGISSGTSSLGNNANNNTSCGNQPDFICALEDYSGSGNVGTSCNSCAICPTPVCPE